MRGFGVLLLLAGCVSPVQTEGRLLALETSTWKAPFLAPQPPLPFTIGEEQHVDWGRVKADVLVRETADRFILEMRVGIPGFGSMDSHPINAWLFHADGGISTFEPSNYQIDSWGGCLHHCTGEAKLELPKQGEATGLLIQVGDFTRYLTRAK